MVSPMKGKTRATRPDSPTITVREFCRLAGKSHETYRRQYRRQVQAGLMPRALPGGIPREEALKWLQAKADAAAAAAARLRPSTSGELSAEAAGE
jgi:hypothetical protein